MDCIDSPRSHAIVTSHYVPRETLNIDTPLHLARSFGAYGQYAYHLPNLYS